MLHYYVDSSVQGESMKKSQKCCSDSGNNKSNSSFLLAVGKDSTEMGISELISWFDLKGTVWRKASGILQT